MAKNSIYPDAFRDESQDNSSNFEGTEAEGGGLSRRVRDLIEKFEQKASTKVESDEKREEVIVDNEKRNIYGDDGPQFDDFEKMLLEEDELDYLEANTIQSSPSNGHCTQSEDADTTQQEALILTRQSEEQPLIGDKTDGDNGQQFDTHLEKMVDDLLEEDELEYVEANTIQSSPSNGHCTQSQDADMTRQEALILRQSEEQPLIGDKESLLALAAEYKDGSPIIHAKIKILSEKYSAIRRTRRDGDCFYRGFIFSYLEHLLQTDKEVAKHVFSDYVDRSFSNFEITTFVVKLISFLHDQTSNIHDFLLQESLNSSVSGRVIKFFRLLASSQIKQRSEFYEPFISSDETVVEYCTNSVERMGHDSDNVEITALSDALKVHTRVVYVDQSVDGEGCIKVNHHDFGPEGDKEPMVTLVYRPGHYDILYR